MQIVQFESGPYRYKVYLCMEIDSFACIFSNMQHILGILGAAQNNSRTSLPNDNKNDDRMDLVAGFSLRIW